MGKILAGAVTIENTSSSDLLRIIELTTKYVGLPIDFADACLVYLGEKFNISEIATIDRDFDIYRLNDKRPFTTYIKEP